MKGEKHEERRQVEQVSNKWKWSCVPILNDIPILTSSAEYGFQIKALGLLHTDHD